MTRQICVGELISLVVLTYTVRVVDQAGLHYVALHIVLPLTPLTYASTGVRELNRLRNYRDTARPRYPPGT